MSQPFLPQAAAFAQTPSDAGVSMGALSKVERGLTSPAWGTVRQIADALAVSLTELAQAVEAEDRA